MSTSSRLEGKRSSGSGPRSRSQRTTASTAVRSRRRSTSSASTGGRFSPRGKRASAVEVTNVSRTGLWLLLDGREIFVPFDRFPWFREAPIGALTRVERPWPHHLRWPDLDVDLDVDSIEHPERYPLVSRAPAPAVAERPAGRRARRR
jgi:hypothetical protein